MIAAKQTAEQYIANVNEKDHGGRGKGTGMHGDVAKYFKGNANSLDRRKALTL